MAATTTAVIGLGISAASAGMSFAQAAKQQRNLKKANEAAARAMQEAKSRLEVNYYDTLSLPKETYELQREAALVQGADALRLSAQAERDTSSTAGRIQMAQNEAQAAIRTDQAQKMFELEKLSVDEKSRLEDLGLQLNLRKAEGAAEAAADAQRAKAQALQQGFSSVGSALGYVGDMVPLYMQNAAGKQFDKQEQAYFDEMSKVSQGSNHQYMKPDGTVMSYQEALGVNNPWIAKMPRADFQEWKQGLNKKQVKQYDPFNTQYQWDYE